MTLAPAFAVKLHDLLLPATRTAFRAARDAHGDEGLYVFGLFVSDGGSVYATFNTRREAASGHARWTPERFVYHARNRVLFTEVRAQLERVAWDDDAYFVVTNTCVDVLATLDRASAFGRGKDRDALVLGVFVAGQSGQEHLAFARRLNGSATLAEMEADVCPRLAAVAY